MPEDTRSGEPTCSQKPLHNTTGKTVIINHLYLTIPTFYHFHRTSHAESILKGINCVFLSNLFCSLVSGHSSCFHIKDQTVTSFSTVAQAQSGTASKRQMLIGNRGSWFLLHTEKLEVFSRASGGCRTERAENQGSRKADKYETLSASAQLCPADLLSHSSFIFDLNLDVNATKPRSLKPPTVLCPCQGCFWSPASPPRNAAPS